MTTRNGVYKCGVCGNIVAVLTGEQGVLTCCDAPMDLMVENITDAAHEKHVPVVIGIGDDIEVSVGSVAHPMQAECIFQCHPTTDSTAKWTTCSRANWTSHSCVNWTTDSSPKWTTFS